MPPGKIPRRLSGRNPPGFGIKATAPKWRPLTNRSRRAQHKPRVSHPASGSCRDLGFSDFPFFGRKTLPAHVYMEEKKFVKPMQGEEKEERQTLRFSLREGISRADFEGAKALLAEHNKLLGLAAKREHALNVSMPDSAPHWRSLESRLRFVDGEIGRGQRSKLKLGPLRKERARLSKTLARMKTERDALQEHNAAVQRAREIEAALISRFYE